MNIPKSADRPETQVRELARTIRKRIQSERLEEGALFMTEAQLADEYQTSRTVTREAVSRLQALGILEGRKRKGLIVRRPDPFRLFQNSLPSLVTSPEDWRDLGQFRYALEVGAIELAIRVATTEQIERLAELESELEREVLEDPASTRSVELDIKFHSMILEMTGSRMIAGMSPRQADPRDGRTGLLGASRIAECNSRSGCGASPCHDSNPDSFDAQFRGGHDRL